MIRKNTYMLSFAEIEKFALYKINQHLSSEWRFEFSEKMTSAFGYCYSNKVIRLSTIYTKLNIKFFHLIKDIILHEIAHAMQYEKQGIMTHDKNWKKHCIKIGAIPSSRFSIFDVTCPLNKWAIRNSVCGKVYEYHNTKPTIPVEEYGEMFIEEPEYPNQFELVWCGI